MTKTSAGYSPEVRTRAVRMVLDHQADRRLHGAQYCPICTERDVAVSQRDEIDHREISGGQNSVDLSYGTVSY
jgi:hypothetical protein